MDKPRKAAIVLPYLKSRGTERQGLAIARQLHDRGWSVCVIVLERMGDFFDAFEDAGLALHVISDKPLESRGMLPYGKIQELARLFRREKVDVVVSRAGMSNNTTTRSARLARIPSVIFVSGPVYAPAPANPVRSLYRQGRESLRYGLATRIVCVSTTGAERLRRRIPLLASRVRAVQNGVDFERVSTLSKATCNPALPDAFNVLYAGSLDEHRKGLDVLVRAFHGFSRGVDDSRLVFVGTGKDEARLRDQVKSLGLEDRVLFAGEQHNPYPSIGGASVFVLPSRREGFPNVLLEAMALGVACIASDCDTGPSELIVPEHNGILVPVGDEQGIADALARLYRDPSLRRRLGENAQQTVARDFRLEDKMSEFEQVLLELLNRKKRKQGAANDAI